MRKNEIPQNFTLSHTKSLSLSHWLYTQNGLNLFWRWQHSKKMLTKRERRSFFFFRQHLS